MRQRRDARRPDEAATARVAQPPIHAVLQLQRSHGNAFVTRMLQRQVQTPIRSGTGMVAEADSAPVYAKPDANEPAQSQLPRGKEVKLTATAGEFYAVEFDAVRGYVRQTDLATAVDSLPADQEAAFALRAEAASKKLDGRKQGTALRGAGTAPSDPGTALPLWFMSLQHKLSMSKEWGAEEQEAQQVLRDYATWFVQSWHGEVPVNLKGMFEYLGSSSINDEKARKGGYNAASHFGGGLKEDGRPKPNWCTQCTTTGLFDALATMGFAPNNRGTFVDNATSLKGKSAQIAVSAPAAYTAPLRPGDMVMYLFDECQYGGHTVTVVDDLGDSFSHISGNTGDAISVGIGEAKRLKTTPRPKQGGKFSLNECNKSDTEKERKESNAYIKRWDFGGAKLVYSIVHFGEIFEELEHLPNMPPAEQQKLLDRFQLRRISVPV